MKLQKYTRMIVLNRIYNEQRLEKINSEYGFENVSIKIKLFVI